MIYEFYENAVDNFLVIYGEKLFLSHVSRQEESYIKMWK